MSASIASLRPACRISGVDPCRAFHSLEARLKSLEGQALTDSLTGAFGREAIEEQGRNEISRMERYGHPCTLISMDLDDLGAVNERDGRDAGDAMLGHFCKLVSHVARRSDRLGRHGDDEFFLVLANTPLATGLLMAERIRGALMYLPSTGESRLSASIAVVEARQGEAWEALLARATAALARAKANKPNYVQVEENPEEPVSAERVCADFVKLHWRTMYESGQGVIDEEHRNLFNSANAMLAAVANDLPLDEVTALVGALLDEVTRHFNDEEAILREAGWEGLEDHAAIHAQLLGRARALATDWYKGCGKPAELFEFLVFELVAAHLLREDRRFFPVLERHRALST